MSATRKEVEAWLATLSADAVVAIDDGGLTLREVGANGKYTEAWLVIGGCTTAEEDDEEDAPEPGQSPGSGHHVGFFEHAGVKIYHTLNDFDMTSENFFSRHPGFNSEAEEAWDWRDLPAFPRRPEQAAFSQRKYFELYPGDALEDVQKRRIAYAIDTLRLPGEE